MKKLICLVLFALIPLTSAFAVDWRKYEGSEVNMICFQKTWCNALKNQDLLYYERMFSSFFVILRGN